MPKSFTHILSLTFLLFTVPYRGNAAGDQDQGSHVHEITMATPDTIAVEVRDDPFKRGAVLELEETGDGPVGSWIRHRDGWEMVIGTQQRHLRLADDPLEVFSTGWIVLEI